MDLKQLFGYEGKTVVVSGAYSGMGLAAARLLHELGANVYTICRRNGRHSGLDFPVAGELYADFGVAPYLLALCVAFQTEREAIGNDFAVLSVLSNCCHEVHPFFWRIGRNQGLLKGLCAFLCALRFLEPV